MFFILSSLITCSVWVCYSLNPVPLWTSPSTSSLVLPHPTPPFSSPPLHPFPRLFRCIWIKYCFWSSRLYISHLCLWFFFRVMRGTAPWQCSCRRTWVGSLEEMTKISSFWVSVYFHVYFVCFNYMQCQWYPTPLSPSAPPPSTPPVPPSFTYLLSIQVYMNEIVLFIQP